MALRSAVSLSQALTASRRPTRPTRRRLQFISLLVVSGVASGLDPVCDNRLLSPRRSLLAVERRRSTVTSELPLTPRVSVNRRRPAVTTDPLDPVTVDPPHADSAGCQFAHSILAAKGGGYPPSQPAWSGQSTVPSPLLGLLARPLWAGHCPPSSAIGGAHLHSVPPPPGRGWDPRPFGQGASEPRSPF